jgi:hypothetical protein
MAMSSTTNFTVDDSSDIGDTCLFALVEAKMKDMAQVVEALNGEDEECGGNSARFPSTFEIRSTFFYKATADVEIDVEIDEVACIKAIRTNINAGGAICLGAILLGAVFGAAVVDLCQPHLLKSSPKRPPRQWKRQSRRFAVSSTSSHGCWSYMASLVTRTGQELL